MAKLHVIQAKYGDSLLIEFGSSANPKFILIDGGPAGVFKNNLKSELLNIVGEGGTLEALMISHIDTDHIKGVLELLTEIKKQRDQDKPEILAVKELWHNSFSKTIDLDGSIINRLDQICTTMADQSVNMENASMIVNSQAEANKVRTFANALNIPINIHTDNNFYSLNNTANAVTFGDLKLTVIGPTDDNLLQLRNEWTEWLEERIEEISDGKFDMTAYEDDTAPNLSSITMVAKVGETVILFTGDARGDHIIEGLKKKRFLKYGKFHCNILKVPHHGSDRNTSREFFEKITADTYVISADGKNGNPDYPTLTWIVEAAFAQKREINIIVTNNTASTKKLKRDYKPDKYKYSLTFIEKNKNSLSIDL